jgi:hypothetical protein
MRKRLSVPSVIAALGLDFGFLTGPAFETGSGALGIPLRGSSSPYNRGEF